MSLKKSLNENSLEIFKFSPVFAVFKKTLPIVTVLTTIWLYVPVFHAEASTPTNGITTFNVVGDNNAYIELARTTNGSAGFTATDVNGWDISGYTTPGASPFIIAEENWGVGSDGRFAYVGLETGNQFLTSVHFSSNDGKLFDLNSIDLGYDMEGTGDLSFIITGYKSGSPVSGATLTTIAFASFGHQGTWERGISTSSNPKFQGIDEFRITPSTPNALNLLDFDNINAVNFRAEVTDVIAPSLTDIGSSNITATTSTVSVTSNESATMYYVLTTNSSPPTSAQIMAGQDNMGVPVSISGNGTATATVPKDFNITNLNAGTQYYVYFVAKDSSNNVSSVGNASFTTLAANAAPVASNVSINGTAQVGQTLTGSYTYTDANSDLQGTSTFKWYRSDDASGSNKTAISLATATTYELQVADLGKFISFEVTPVALTGTPTGVAVESTRTSAVIVAEAAPVASNVSINGTAQVGQTLTGSYTYNDANSDLQGTSTFKWYRSDDASGLNKTAISLATATTYELQVADLGKFISFEVTPVALTGTLTGVAIESARSSAVIVAEAAPVASNVSIDGTAQVGQTLTGSYTYNDANADLQGTSTFKWYRSDDASGLNKTAISLATGTTYVLQVADLGKFISFEVTPVALTGTLTGVAVESTRTSAVIVAEVAPVASNVSINGTAQVGQTLTGSYTYNDANSDLQGTSTFKWYRSDDASGLNKTAISLATATTYELQVADLGKFISFEVTPVALTGTQTGVAVESTRSSAVLAAQVAPVASNVSINGTAQVGQTLTGSYTYTDANSDLQGTSTFKWYRSDDASGSNKTAISLATGTTYELQAADLGKFISFEATPVALTGTLTGVAVESTRTSAVIVAEAAPVASNVNINGTAQVGQTLTGSYTYNDANADLQGTSTFKWYRSDDASGLNKTAISLATATTYELQVADLGKFISFEVTPVALTGTLTGVAVESARSSAVIVAEAVPVASNVSINGTAQVGQTLTGSYTYNDANSDLQGTSTFKWYRSDDASGSNKTAISLATGTTYELQAADLGKFISFEVTPVALTGTLTGVAVESARSSAVVAAQAAPVASNVSINGTAQVGQTLTGSYTYNDANSDLQGTSTFKWYRSDDASGLNKTAISLATATTYELQVADLGKFISFEVTPVALTGTLTGVAVESARSSAVIVAEAVPVASNVSINGTAQVGQTLTGSYTYNDANADLQGTSTFKWYRSDDASGSNKTAISLATATTYELQVADLGKFISFEVTPVALTGTLTGVAVESTRTSAVVAITVAFESNGGTTTVSQTVAYNGIASEPPAPTKTGYSFAGWYSDSGLNSTFTFTTAIINDTILYAKWTKIETTSSSPDVTSVPTTTVERITVNVEDSGSSAGGIVSSAVIERTTKADGTKKDNVIFTVDQVKKSVESIVAAGSTSASIIIPDTKDEVSEIHVTLPLDVNKTMADAKFDWGVTTENVKIVIPNASLQGFTDDLYFNFIPIKEESKKKEVKDRANKEVIVKIAAGNKEATVVGRPMTIETNMQNRHVKLIMPLKDVVLTPNEMKDLGIYIEHSDGTKELLQGVLVPYNNKGEMGLEFTVNKFSTFTLVHIEGLGKLKQHTAYMNGYEDNTFKSENMITRAEMAAILSRVITRATAKADMGYSDVASTHWAKDAISNVTKMGLMQGYSDGSFAPEKSISRAEMASLASALLGDTQQLGTGFTDITSHWAQAYILKSQGTGIISGYADGTFKPENSLTRAEAVTILNKVLGRSALNGVAQSSWKDVSNTHWALRDIEEASVDHTFKKTTDGGEQWVQKP